METAKVDIRKLQVLNDRINQTIDALNQVRLSVHGLSHTSAVNPMQQGFAQQTGFAGNDPRFASGIGALGQGQGFIGQQGVGSPFVSGLSHTAMPFGVQGFNQGFNPATAGFGIPSPFLQGVGQGIGTNPYLPGQGIGINPNWVGVGGLSHSGGENLESYGRPIWSDPLLAARLAQTFPYAQYAVPPVVTLY
jgi:hypothetical protein